MKLPLELFTILAVSLTFVGNATSGPFGFTAGQSESGIRALVSLEGGKQYLFSSDTAPSPHHDFNQFQLLITPVHGLCKIIAFTKTINTTLDGAEVIAKFVEFSKAMTEKYGEWSSTTDDLREGSKYKLKDEWMVALAIKDRTLTRFWFPNSSRLLPDRLSAIELFAGAIGATEGFLTITYEFDNTKDCLVLARKIRNSVL